MNGETRPDISKMAFSEMIRLEGNASLSFFSLLPEIELSYTQPIIIQFLLKNVDLINPRIFNII